MSDAANMEAVIDFLETWKGLASEATTFRSPPDSSSHWALLVRLDAEVADLLAELRGAVASDANLSVGQEKVDTNNPVGERR